MKTTFMAYLFIGSMMKWDSFNWYSRIFAQYLN